MIKSIKSPVLKPRVPIVQRITRAWPERPVDATLFQQRTRRRMGWVALLRTVKAQLEDQGFRWNAVVGEV